MAVAGIAARRFRRVYVSVLISTIAVAVACSQPALAVDFDTEYPRLDLSSYFVDISVDDGWLPTADRIEGPEAVRIEQLLLRPAVRDASAPFLQAHTRDWVGVSRPVVLNVTIFESASANTSNADEADPPIAAPGSRPAPPFAVPNSATAELHQLGDALGWRVSANKGRLAVVITLTIWVGSSGGCFNNGNCPDANQPDGNPGFTPADFPGQIHVVGLDIGDRTPADPYGAGKLAACGF